jgi:hypothetical protein
MMAHALHLATERAEQPSAYESGRCNIGPAEIARRRMTGHIGLVVTVAMLGALVVADAPPAWRLVLFLPAAVGASGYLQAWLRFCAGFGSRGVYNFGPLGESVPVTDAADRARDRARANRIGLAAAAIGAAVALAAVSLPS